MDDKQENVCSQKIPLYVTIILLLQIACSRSHHAAHSECKESKQNKLTDCEDQNCLSQVDCQATNHALTGCLRSDSGEPIEGAMLSLCGNIDGKEVCKQNFSQKNGCFVYQDYYAGYTKLDIQTYPVFAKTNIMYAGAVIALNTQKHNCLNLGTIMLPEINEATTLAVETGGNLNFDAFSLAISPNSTTFPGLEKEGPVGAVSVDKSAVTYFSLPDNTVSVWAFFPFWTVFQPAVDVVFYQERLEKIGCPTSICLYWNDPDTGGLSNLGCQMSQNNQIIFQGLPVLSWIVLTCE